MTTEEYAPESAALKLESVWTSEEGVVVSKCEFFHEGGRGVGCYSMAVGWGGESMQYFRNGKLGSLGPRDARVEGILFTEFCGQLVR